MKHFIQPQKQKNYQNKLRKAGFELEFSNIDLDIIVSLLQKECSLKKEKINNYLYKFHSKYGSYTLELDFELLTKQTLKQNIKEFSQQLGIAIAEQDIDTIESFVGDLSKDVVPYEISTPPIPIDQLEVVENLVEILSQNNALGTKGKLYYAFGLHINLEVISLEATSLLDYLRAYVILQEYLTKDAKVDIVRKITPFIDSFKKEYIEFILDENYQPDQKGFIEDYLHFNPTRNRSLDMLPILAFLDEKTVREKLPNQKIKPRPTFHYRLSNSMIGEEDWSVANEWNRWILVEKLANDRESLKELSKNYLHYLDTLINLTSWESQIEQWIQNHS